MHFFLNLRWQDLVDILLVAIIIYQVVLVLKGTQAIQVLAGLFLLFLAYLVARQLEFFTLEWLLDLIVKSFVLIVIILFQADIRRVLSRVGKKALAPGGIQPLLTTEEICEAAETLASRHFGALFALERYIGLSEYLDGAIKLDALVTKELLISLFWPHTPTHDGAVIIQGERVGGAGCLLPLSKNPNLDPTLGTRHRAAVGLTENTDAVVLVVSETTGQISLARSGGLRQNLSPDQLRRSLRDLMETPNEGKGTWFAKVARFIRAS
ncbi:MAG: diadenylate cyclase CdaA [Deltaproteobacteria bacterium]|nr:diadenylate cyclase CdaA [Deltaproteobacteria bacterium]